MDKPTDPRGPNDIPGPEGSGSEQDFGATGVFKAVQPSGATTELAAGQGAAAGTQGRRPADPFNPPSFMGSRPLAEPVVHKVVLGGGAESSPELLDRIRLASQEKASTPERPAAAPSSGGKPGGGFTELLRTLEVEMPSATAASKGAPPPEPKPAAQDSGFTSLLRTLGAQEPAAPAKIGQAAPASAPQDLGRVAPAPRPSPGPAQNSGGFTELLRTAPGADPVMTYPLGSRPATAPPPAENKPGTFTQLFGTLGGSEVSPSAPPPGEKTDSAGASAGSFTRMLSIEPPVAPPPSERADSSGGGAGSFTRMLSLEPPAEPAEMPRFEQSKPIADRLNYGLAPEPGRPAAASSSAFSPQPLSEPEPAPIAPQSGGVGITRLIQMLDEPSKAPIPQSEAPPRPPAAGPGVWTQTFASLSPPNDPPEAAAKAPDWAPPHAPPTATAYPVPPAAHRAPTFSEPAMNAPPAASGPSEFTRILDASRMREMAMRGGQAAGAEGAVPAPPPPQSSAPPPPPPMPSYPVPVTPPSVGMQSGGGIPRPAVYPPSVPQAPGMYAPTPQIPQAPGMYVPTPPMPSAPPAQPPKPAPPPAAGGLQQMVPILLVVVIVLLVVLIVTVFFLMKH
jgi:hypothetical protein